MALLPIHSANYSQIRKRSYRKACRQAQRDESSAVYRGRPLTLRQIASQGHCPPTAVTSPHPSVRSESRGGRQFRPLRVLSCNPGHLGAQQWSEIKDWLQAEAQSVCDVLLLQETHRSSTAQFQVSGWTCISSASSKPPAPEPKAKPRGKRQQPQAPATAQPCEAMAAPSKVDGVVILLHRVGRLLEVRFVHAGCPFVALNAYQHVWSSAKTPQQNRKDRSSFLASLSKAVRQVPSRTSLVVAGDLNATLSPSPRLVGPRACGAAPRPVQELVETHKLVALNTWHAAIPHTYTQQGSHSQIDFIFTKEPQAGGQAKRSAPLHDWHLGSWKVGGHSPVFAAVKPLGHWQLPLRKEASTCDVKQLQAEVREGSDRAKQMRDWVRDRMPVHHPDQCNQILTEAAELFFPRRGRSCQRPLDSRRMWQLAREVKSSPNPDPARLAELEATQEQHRQQVRQRQKERAAKFLEGVDEAIAEGSPR